MDTLVKLVGKVEDNVVRGRVQTCRGDHQRRLPFVVARDAVILMPAFAEEDLPSQTPLPSNPHHIRHFSYVYIGSAVSRHAERVR
ncbi:hypothetical protein Dda_2329 [Drechslerella dactyloides]|uniref:Uncharacterized protein n=1 Tax=Drechslerella dactyloides TaxID=74499 RepID=A0AAD6J3B9_DREDA|nr:hypothetical protein Dda_2329 [Drechslerella dactyloides]